MMPIDTGKIVVDSLTFPDEPGGEPYFPLLIAGDSGSAHVSISYYCSRLKRIYSIEDWMPFTPGMSPMQDGKPYVLNFFPIEK